MVQVDRKDLKPATFQRALPQVGDGSTRSGTLATASGLVFFGEDSGAFMAVDAATGKPLWHFQTSQMLRASPMTYSFDGRQYVAVVAAGKLAIDDPGAGDAQSLIAYALP